MIWINYIVCTCISISMTTMQIGWKIFENKTQTWKDNSESAEWYLKEIIIISSVISNMCFWMKIKIKY